MAFETLKYNSDNWEPEFMTIFDMTLDSICSSCDVSIEYPFLIQAINRQSQNVLVCKGVLPAENLNSFMILPQNCQSVVDFGCLMGLKAY